MSLGICRFYDYAMRIGPTAGFVRAFIRPRRWAGGNLAKSCLRREMSSFYRAQQGFVGDFAKDP